MTTPNILAASFAWVNTTRINISSKSDLSKVTKLCFSSLTKATVMRVDFVKYLSLSVLAGVVAVACVLRLLH